MPRIGDYNPKVTPYFPGNSPGPVRAPGLPDTSGNLADIAIASGTQSANAVTQAGVLGRDLLLNAGNAALTGLNVYQRKIAALTVQRDAAAKAQHAMNVNHSATNHAQAFELEAYKLSHTVDSDKAMNPISKPKVLEDGLNNLREAYVKGNNIIDKDVLEGFKEKTTPTMTNMLKAADDSVLHWQSENALSLSRATNEATVNDVTDPARYIAEMNRSNSPDIKQKFYVDFGAKGEEERQKFQQAMGINLVRSVANNDPKNLKKLQESGVVKNIPAEIWNSAATHADQLEATALANAVAHQTLRESTAAAHIAAATGLLDPTDPAYRTKITQSQQTLKKQLAEQLVLPPPPPDAVKPVIDRAGNFVPTQNVNTINKIRNAMSQVDEMAKSYDATLTKQQVAKQNEIISNFIQEQAAKKIGPEAQKANADLQDAILNLNKFTPGLGLLKDADIARAKKNYVTTDSELQAYSNLANIYHGAVSKGLVESDRAKAVIDLMKHAHDRIEAGHKAPDGMSMWNWITGAKQPDAKYKSDVETMLHKVLTPDTSGVDYIMKLGHNMSGSATQRIVSSELINWRNMYKARNGGAEPSAAQADHVNKKIQVWLVTKGMKYIVPDVPKESREE